MTQRMATPGPNRWWLVVITAIAAVVSLVGFLAFRSSPIPPGYSSSAEAWDLPGIDGTGHVRLADFRGRPVVANFFASWCTACDLELPGFAAVSEQLRGRVTFIGVNALETGDRMLMPERHGITWWPLARDIGTDGNDLHRALEGLDAMPLTAWYDADGRLLHVDRGALPEQALRQRLAELYGISLPEPGSGTARGRTATRT
ncbi:MAG: TlpA family protein disulfide reductase, partial [Sporichthyaceae bacterium]|nr:TlpA family protein disulfide reductase [Sporichthyaceae bacterium]